MFKSLPLLLIASFFIVTESSAMHPEDRKNKMAARLKKKLDQKKPEHELVKELRKVGEILLDASLERKVPDNALTDGKPLPSISSPITYTDSIYNVFTSLENTKISEQQIAGVKKTLSLQGLDIEQALTIQENFESSLESSMRYQKRVKDLLTQETKFHNKIISEFPATEAFAAHVLPFTHKSRKELTLALIFSSKNALSTLLICSEPLKGQGLRNPRFLMRAYVDLFKACEVIHFCSVSTTSSFDENNALFLKYRRLNSSFYDGEIELLLKYSNLLERYVKIIQSVLKFDNFDEAFGYKKIIEDVLDKQRIENQRGPVLLTKYKLFLQERARKNSQFSPVEPAKLPTRISIESSSQNQRTLPEKFIEEIHSPVNTNEKSKYRGPSEQEMIAERKRQGKEKKQNNAATIPLKELEPKSSSEKECKPSVKIDSFIQIGGGPFKIFNKVMDLSFKRTIEKIVLLIEALGGSIDDGRSGSRIKIELPHINSNKRAYLDLLPPEEGDESEETNSQAITITNTTTTTSTTAESVMHAPHKGKSKKLRFYHTQDVRELVMDAGYTPHVVLKTGSQQ